VTEVFGVDLFEPRPGQIFNVRDWHNNPTNIPLIEYKKCDLALESIPFDDNTFDVLTAIDVLEHIPRIAYSPHQRYPFIELMNEIWRVLKFGGLFFSVTPNYPHAEAFSDPTHVNFVTKETFTGYFVEPNRYGFKGSFEIKQI
jgi:SAM-dependent methyltransferase